MPRLSEKSKLSSKPLKESGRFVTLVKEPLVADIHLVLEQKFKELRIGQPIGFSLQKT